MTIANATTKRMNVSQFWNINILYSQRSSFHVRTNSCKSSDCVFLFRIFLTLIFRPDFSFRNGEALWFFLVCFIFFLDITATWSILCQMTGIGNVGEYKLLRDMTKIGPKSEWLYELALNCRKVYFLKTPKMIFEKGAGHT